MSDYKNFLKGRGFNAQETEYLSKFADNNDGTYSSYKSGSHPEMKIIFKTGETKRLYITKVGGNEYNIKNNYNQSTKVSGFDGLTEYMEDL